MARATCNLLRLQEIFVADWALQQLASGSRLLCTERLVQEKKRKYRGLYIEKYTPQPMSFGGKNMKRQREKGGKYERKRKKGERKRRKGERK